VGADKKNATPSQELGSSVNVLASKGLYVPSETALGRNGPFGAALVTGARHSPCVSSQVGTQPSSARALFAFTQVDGTGQSGPAAACPMGVALWSPRETRSLRPFCSDVRQPAIWGCTSEPAVPLSYGGGRCRGWHTGATSTTFCRSDGPKRLVVNSGLTRDDGCLG
jgi:hypothetical protein